jgi:hypothetical protein
MAEHWTQAEDRRRGERMREERERDARRLAESEATHDRAVAAKRAKYGWSLSDIDFDAPSVTEQQYAAQQAEADRWRRWLAYATEKNARGVFKADGTPFTYDVTAPPDWYK